MTLTSYAVTIPVGAGGDFQAALNSAKPGDTITLLAGASYITTSGFILPNKGTSTLTITIQSSALTSLPAAGNRVHPSDAVRMPKVLSSVNGIPSIQTATSAHHYQFRGIEFAPASGHWAYEIIGLGTGTETTLAQLPHDITIDRCYIHGDPTAQPGTKRGIGLNAANVSVLNSYISEIHVVAQDSQGLASFNGPGPFHILNNYIEAAAENVLFGGVDPAIPNLVPSDIEFRNNYLFKPLSWKVGDPSYAGIPWQVKNLFELKNAQRVVVDGNVFENCWSAAQTGVMVLFTPRNQDGTAPWSVVQDVSFTHNILRNTASAMSIAGEDDLKPSQQTRRITIRDNIVEHVDSSVYGGAGRIFQLGTPGRPSLDVVIDHNTLLHNATSGGATVTVGDCCTVLDRFTFTNNLATHASYGFKGAGTGEGLTALAAFVTNYTFNKNAFIGGGRAVDYPVTTFFPAAVANVGFKNAAIGDYHLLSTSAYKGAGTDGLDLGANVDAVNVATCGTKQGIPSSACASVPLVSPCDINGNGVTDILDVQIEVNQIVGTLPCTGDVNRDTICNVIDLQRVLNVTLGGPCVSP